MIDIDIIAASAGDSIRTNEAVRKKGYHIYRFMVFDVYCLLVAIRKYNLLIPKGQNIKSSKKYILHQS